MHNNLNKKYTMFEKLKINLLILKKLILLKIIIEFYSCRRWVEDQDATLCQIRLHKFFPHFSLLSSLDKDECKIDNLFIYIVSNFQFYFLNGQRPIRKYVQVNQPFLCISSVIPCFFSQVNE